MLLARLHSGACDDVAAADGIAAFAVSSVGNVIVAEVAPPNSPCPKPDFPEPRAHLLRG